MQYPTNIINPTQEQLAALFAKLATYLTTKEGKAAYRNYYQQEWAGAGGWQSEMESYYSSPEERAWDIQRLQDNARTDALSDICSDLGFCREDILDVGDCQDNLTPRMWVQSRNPLVVAERLATKVGRYGQDFVALIKTELDK